MNTISSDSKGEGIMKSIIPSFVVIALAVAVAHENELPLAEACNSQACQLPDCRCSSTEIPGGLKAKDTPQFVTVTFDDAINILNMETYRDILYNRFNKNNCTAGATFYVSHEYTNYVLVNDLYNNRFEIALHSISHQTPQTYWSEAKIEDMRKEFGEQKIQLSHLANIPLDAIQGLRIPFLQMTGNASFQVMSENDIAYDSSWPTVSHLWPYTLDYASTQECVIPPCPTASFPGTWVLPMVSWLDLNGVACSMADACYWTPAFNDEDAWFQFMVTNFERHYLGNRAPFGVYLHEAYLVAHPAVKNALVRFMDLINNLNDVFMVNTREVLEWVQNPIPVDEYLQKPCRIQYAAPCIPFSCGPLTAAHNQLDYWMPNCKVCPNVYPWLGNPLGL